MNMKKFFAVFAALLGEVLIIALLLLFRGDLPNNILWLNGIVCTLACVTFVWILFVRWDRSSDESDAWIGSLGINLMSLNVYSIVAIALVLFMNYLPFISPVGIKWQLLIHGILIFGLAIFQYFSYSAAEQVEKVGKSNQQQTEYLKQMKDATRKLQDTAFITAGVDQSIRNMIDGLQQDIRFLSPLKNDAAHELEQDYLANVATVTAAFSNYAQNEAVIAKQISLLKHIVENRRKMYN
ncbi:MAG: hypothetical protein IJ911_02085 [Salinivirgaceae bacterium]|nr:hypothetical protein [Salinivirgaceae bacterium]